MRQVLSGAGVDTTSAVAAYLVAGNQLRLAELYLIGDYDDPQAIRLTNWESPLNYPIWGIFLPSVVSRGTFESKIGLEVTDLQVTWTPVLTPPTVSIATANPYQLAQMGYYDNRILRCWVTVMPTPGDANTYGAYIAFGGRIGKTVVERGKITFTVNSFLDVVNEMVPTNVIELTNTGAGFVGATPPAGCVTIPQFNVIAGSVAGLIIGDQVSPNAHGIFANNQLVGGFLVFNGGAGSTLARQYARIAANFGLVVAGTLYNEFILYGALPWGPTAGTDTFYVSGPAKVNTGELENAVLNAGGTGYSVGDILTIQGLLNGSVPVGSGATVQVMATGGGGTITASQMISGGSGYYAQTAATVTGGTGTGATFDLTLPDLTQGFPFVPAPNVSLAWIVTIGLAGVFIHTLLHIFGILI
jgi:hypothetical protein